MSTNFKIFSSAIFLSTGEVPVSALFLGSIVNNFVVWSIFGSFITCKVEMFCCW